jgi:hypothetical protein
MLAAPLKETFFCSSFWDADRQKVNETTTATIENMNNMDDSFLRW